MASKLEAARIATAAGENVVIAGGKQPGNLMAILSGKPVGTLFVARGEAVPSWKRWIGMTAQPRGKLVTDDGARQAVERSGRSLLAIGVVAAEGAFRKGDVVAICDRQGHEFARGLTNYSADDMQQIKGLKTDQIAAALGHCPYEEVVHRDNLAVC